MKKQFLLIILLFSVFTTDFAQNRNPIYSPTYNADGTVTFTLKAPHAKEVLLSSQFLKQNEKMQKNDEGIWTITCKPEPADIYPYNFIVDGTAINDPGNTNLFPNEFFKASIMEMPNPDALYTMKSVPHGKLQYMNYYSNQLRQWRPLVIYTPASYDRKANKKYPVLYLISGTTDTEETWSKVGKANVIADNLIAAGKAEEMIIVMPFGYMNAGTPAPTTDAAVPMYKSFAKELTEGILPFVEGNFRTINDADHRAIAGFSRGGGQTLFTTYSNIDKFGWMAAYSAYLTPKHYADNFPNIAEDVKKLKMHWFGVGTKDFLYNNVKENLKYFDDKGIKYELMETIDHSHTWMHCRIVLAETLQKFFKTGIEPCPGQEGVTMDNRTCPGYTIYKPNNLAKQNGKMPVMIFGNGGCSHDSKYYIPMLAEMVRQGYLVMAVSDNPNVQPSDEPHSFATIGKDDCLLDAVNWICEQNVLRGSEFYGKIDVDNIGVSGHSCGGAQALRVSYDKRIKTTILFNSGINDMEMANCTAESAQQLHSPILYLIGGPEDIAYENAKVDFERINNVPIAMVNYKVGHGGTYGEPQGGILGKVALQWMNWQMKGDKSAKKYFVDKNFRDKNYPGADFQSKKIR